MQILMCVPNISEGRDPGLVEKVANEIRKTPGVMILDCSSDQDHNRSVLTYLGEPQAVLAATKAMAAKSLELIDMTKHKGSHPRIGAVDVVPFVPIRGVETTQAREIARAAGKFFAGLGVPVYYYAAAGDKPERTTPSSVRQGQYEGLKERLKDPAWQPDEGPATFNPKSGAVAVGVRMPLIAFNVNLRTTDVSIADRIAKAVRNISGGYRYVRAMGLSLQGQDMVQVSMDLDNYIKTPIPRVLETVRAEAARYGVSVAGTEFIGPVPLGALVNTANHYLQSHDFKESQVIESFLLDMMG